MKFKRGHHSHDNMGPEFEVRFPLIFGYYVVRTVGKLDWLIMHERDLT
jgi:hypothetical protein